MAGADTGVMIMAGACRGAGNGAGGWPAGMPATAPVGGRPRASGAGMAPASGELMITARYFDRGAVWIG